MVAIVAVALVVAVAALAVAATVVWRAFDCVKSVHNDAMQLSRANSDMKFMPTIIQTASALSERVDERVRARITTINSAMRTKDEGPAPQGKTLVEPPPMGTSTIIDDVHEIERGLRRHTSEFVPPELAAREPGIGADPGYPPESI